MIITHIGKYFAPDKGGIETVTELLSQIKSKSIKQVNILCFSKSNNLNSKKSSSVNILRCNSFVLFSQPISFTYFFKGIYLLYKSDIIHLHFPNIIGQLLCFFTNKPVIVHWHSDIIGKYVLNAIITPFHHLLLSKCKVIICTSKEYSLGSKILRNYHRKIKIIPLGITDPVIYNNSQPDLIKEKNYVLSVGRLVSYKGFLDLVKAFKLLKSDHILYIVGNGPQYSQLIQLITELNLNHRIFILTNVSDSDLKQLYSHADCYCLSSNTRAEAFGVVLLEALAWSLPIVSTRILHSGVSWVNENHITGLQVPPSCPSMLANALDQILSDKSLQKILGLNSRQRYVQLFSDKKFQQSFLALYKSLHF
jgi:glycosyltransferase involved in cell wall biosynthesis